MDSSLFFDESIGELHHQRRFKFYCFDQLYPMESNKIYQVGKPYTLTIRTIKKDLAIYFDRVLSHHESSLLQGKSTEIRTVPYRPIDRLYSITPVVLKNDKGYWRDWMTLSEYENQLFINLVKKYNESTGKKLDENYKKAVLQSPLNVKCLVYNCNRLIKKYSKEIAFIEEFGVEFVQTYIEQDKALRRNKTQK